MSTLRPPDLEMFARLGISRDLLDAARVERVSDIEARNDFGILSRGDLSGIVFPYYLPNGNGRVTARLRRDHPEIEDEKPKNKYLYPRNDIHHLYFPPGSAELLADPASEIVFVEAEKSALALTAWAERNDRKVLAIATGGCWGWRGTIGKTVDATGARVGEKGPLPDLAVAAGHPCTILFDANTATNAKVESARYAFTDALKRLKAASISTPNLPTRGNPNVNGPDDFLREYGDNALAEVLRDKRKGPTLGSSSVADLFAANQKIVDWLAWPFAAVGFASIIDALPKVGKTEAILRAILASRLDKPFLGYPTKPMRVLYVSEQSKASLAMQLRHVGFTGEEPVEELRFITREDWSRFTYEDLLVQLEEEYLKRGNYNVLVIDTFHTVARMEDERDASEVNRLGNLTLDVASRNNLTLVLGRHDRKSGGEVGVSGRSSIQLSGLVDVILHLVRIPGKDNQRKLETISRVPNLPTAQIIELVEGTYMNWGEPVAAVVDRDRQVVEWYAANPAISAPQLVERFAELSIKVSLATAKRHLAKVKGGLKP